MSQTNQLKLNDDKTEFMIIGKPNSLKDLPPERAIKIRDEYIVATDTAKNIGVVVDSQLHMDSQINSICKSSYMYLHFISNIKPFLTAETVSTLVHALVTSRLDNCNSLLYGCYDCLLKRLQMVHNCSARLILGRRKYDRVTPMLAELHWLPVKERIIYKICLFAFKCLDHSAPQYLQDLIIPYKQERSLRSANKNLIEKYAAVQKRTAAGKRSFAFNAGKYWNLLPKELRFTRKIDRFKSDLKTFLFENVPKFKPFL